MESTGTCMHTHTCSHHTHAHSHTKHTCKHMHTHIYVHMHKVMCVCLDQLCFQPGLLPRRGCSPVRCLEGTHLCHPFLPFFPPVTLTLAQTPCVTFIKLVLQLAQVKIDDSGFWLP